MWPDARCFGTGHWLHENSVASVNESRSQIGCLSLGGAPIPASQPVLSAMRYEAVS